MICWQKDVLVTPPERARRAKLNGRVERHHDADNLTSRPGDVALVERGVMRALVMACPDGCGERLSVNLDPRSGPAWHLYERPAGLTLFPSVWRESGCGAHFILWNDRILWCDIGADPEDEPDAADLSLPERVLAVATSAFRSTVDIAAELNAVPWEVGQACRRLARKGLLREGAAKLRDHFRTRS